MASRKALEQRLKKIGKELAALKKFRKTKKRDQFIRQLAGEQSSLKRRLSHRPSLSRKRTSRRGKPVRRKAAKARKRRGYLRQIKRAYPKLGLTVKELDSELAKRQKGKKSKVPDVVWRNPSP